MEQGTRDELVSTFCSISGADAHAAEHLLDAHGWDLERSLNFYLEHGGAGVGTHQAAAGPRYSSVDEEPIVVDPPELREGAGMGNGSGLPRIVDSHDNPQAFDLAGAEDAFEQQFQEPALTYARRGMVGGDEGGLEELATLARHRANRVPRGEGEDTEDYAAAVGPNHPRVRRNRRAQPHGPASAGMAAEAAIDVDADNFEFAAPSARPLSAQGGTADLAAAFGGFRGGLGGAGGEFGVVGGYGRLAAAGIAAAGAGAAAAAAGMELGPGRAGLGGAAGVGGPGDGDVPSVPDDMPDLPEGINVEEARMLEAAMLGIPYEGRIPDFSDRPPAAPLDPEAMQRQLLRREQDDAYEASLRADREKQERVERQRREAEEAERKKAEEEAAEKERKAAREALYRRTISTKAESLPAEPAESDPDAVSVLVRLPGGGRCARRFLRSHSVAALFDFVDVSQQGSGLEPGTYRIVAQFPRRVFEDGDVRSLHQAGLDHKQEALMLEMK